jgi:hypothetical protein
MKTIVLAIALLIAAVRCEADWPDDVQLAYLSLERADTFAFGPVGLAAFTAEGDLAVRILVRHSKSIAIFQLFADKANPAGLYALAALHALDRDAYKKSLPQFKASLARDPRKKVTLQAACIAYDEPISDVLTKLDAGKYDSFIPKPK